MKSSALLFSLLTLGCGVSSVGTHARAAIVTAASLEQARTVIYESRARELDQCEDEACLDRIEGNWSPIVTAYEATRTALTVWVETISLWHSSGEDGGVGMSQALGAASRLAVGLDDLARRLSQVGIVPRSLPEELRLILEVSANAR